MKQTEIINHWVNYNKITNEELIELLTPQLTSRLDEPVGSFFKTLGGLLNHLITADLVWFSRFQEYGLWPVNLVEQIAALPKVGYGQPAFTNWDEFLEIRKELDKLWVELAGSLKNDDLDRVIEYKSFQGNMVKISILGLILHLMNHQTHHRGAISQILDQWGIDNDYSGLNKVFSLPPLAP